MENSSISARVETLREEIKVIKELERCYRSTKHHSASARFAHASRELRLFEIRAELDRLQAKKRYEAISSSNTCHNPAASLGHGFPLSGNYHCSEFALESLLNERAPIERGWLGEGQSRSFHACDILIISVLYSHRVRVSRLLA